MLRVAAIQTRSGVEIASNLAAACELITAAAEAGAQLIVTPEMTNVLDKEKTRLFGHLPTDEGAAGADEFVGLAARLGVHLVIGSIAVRLEDDENGPRMANRSLLIGPEGIIARYDKIHLYDVDLPTGESWRESAVMKAGATRALAKTPLAQIGLSICYDVRFPAHYRALAQAGAEVLTIPAAFTVPTGEAHWEVLLRARAIETGSFVIAAAQGGAHEDGRVTYGHSMIIDPWGRVLAEKADDEPGFVTADLDLAQVEDTRTRIPAIHLDRAAEFAMFEA